MSKLVLKFGDKVLKEFTVGAHAVTIGRLPDNVVVIDNAAVSGHHARVQKEGEQIILEDLGSTNGTFVNEHPVTRHPLQEGEVIEIGKHRLEFTLAGGEEAAAAGAAAAPVVPDIGGTMMLDTKHQKELLAKMKAEAEAKKAAAAGPPAPTAPAPAAPKAAAATPAAPAPAPAVPKATPPAAAAPPAASAAPAATAPAEAAPAAAPGKKVGTLTVLSGSTDKPEYVLEAQSVIIGKSDTALVKLKGWFKPDMAAAINRKGESYVLTLLGGKAAVNKQPVASRQDLQDGDVIEVSGVTLHFKIKG